MRLCQSVWICLVLGTLMPQRPAPASTPSPTATVTHAARSLQPGELVVLTITASGDVGAPHVTAFGNSHWPVTEIDRHTWKALVGIDLDVKPGTYIVRINLATAPAPLLATHTLVVRDKAFPTRKLTVDPGFVNPPPEAQERIARDGKELEYAWTQQDSNLPAGPFVRPVPDEANSAFGSRSVFNGEARSPHGGADFLSPAGRPIAAPNDGRVVLAHDLYYTGNTVIISHGLGLFSLFAHLSAIKVQERDAVKAGQIVGEVGATGRVTGPHLHWTVRLNGARIDPLSLLAMLGTSTPRSHPPSSETP